MVRIAPNELVFITPQAESGRGHYDESEIHPQRISDILGILDIYTSHTKNQEHFRKVDSGIPLPDDGISFERDPARHRQLAKKLAGAWSAKSLKTMEPTMHSYIDLFIRKLKEVGDSEDGIDLQAVSAVSNRSDHKSANIPMITFKLPLSGRTDLPWTCQPSWRTAARWVNLKKVIVYLRIFLQRDIR